MAECEICGNNNAMVSGNKCRECSVEEGFTPWQQLYLELMDKLIEGMRSKNRNNEKPRGDENEKGKNIDTARN